MVARAGGGAGGLGSGEPVQYTRQWMELVRLGVGQSLLVGYVLWVRGPYLPPG